tara:strand:+ start:8226 stop:9026 length:801 start_codon:yes stop_codon:yes gene_type:complete
MAKHLTTSLSTLVLMLTAVSPSLSAEPDIVGLKSGMPFSEVRDILSKRTKGYPVDTENDVKNIQGSQIRGWSYPGMISIKTPDRLQEFLVQGLAPPNHAKVASIYRHQMLRGEARLLPQKLLAALENKYGPAHFQSDISRRGLAWLWSWSVDPAGNPITDQQDVLACVGKGGNTIDATMKTHAMQVAWISDAQSHANGTLAHCGQVLMVHASADGSGVLMSYSTLLYDLGAIQASNRETVQLTITERKKLEQERKEQLENAAVPDL